MTTASRLADALIRTITGPMWHGPALAELVHDVSHEQAAARPIPAGHTIWELVLHIAVWAEIPRVRLAGEPRTDIRSEEDWPPPAAGSSEWKLAVARMDAAYRGLARDVAALDDRALDSKVAGHEYSVRAMIYGVIEHGCYHGGQIALLKRAVR